MKDELHDRFATEFRLPTLKTQYVLLWPLCDGSDIVVEKRGTSAKLWTA